MLETGAKPSKALSRNAAIKRLVLLIAIASLVAGIWFLARPFKTLEATPASEAKAPFVDQATVQASRARQQSAARASSHSAQHDHEIPEQLDFSTAEDFRQQAHWYEPAQLGSDGRYLTQSTALKIDASCKDQPALAFPNLEQAVFAQLGLDAREVTPDNVLIEEIAQFWQQDGRFFQISGRWDKDQPARYSMHHFSAADEKFSRDLRHLPLPAGPGLPQQSNALDILSLGEWMDAVLKHALAQGGQAGSRLVHAMPAVAEQTLDLKLNNGRVVSWMFGPGRCQRRTSGDAYCRCIVVPPVSNAASHATHPSQESSLQEPLNVHD